IAFEFARALRRDGCPAPARLFVSGCRAPHLPDPDPPLYSRNDAEFVRELKRLNGISLDVLENAEFMQIIIPLLRADFQLCDTYCCDTEEPLDCPIVAFGGLDDRKATRDQVRSWQRHTRGRFAVRMLPGDHFFVKSSKVELLRAIADDLRQT